MNGPVILHLARQQLADEIVAYRAPAPAPLKISPWLAMSLFAEGDPARGNRIRPTRSSDTCTYGA
jgi:hypothetical protein